MSDKIVEQIQAAMKDIQANQTIITEEMKASAAAAGADAKAALQKAEDAATAVKASAERIIELERNLGEKVLAGTEKVETLGNIIVKSEAFKGFAAGNTQKLRIEANTIIGQDGSPLQNSNTIVPPHRLNGIIPGAFRTLTIRDVLPSGTTSSNMIEYTRELAFTNNAAETNEGVTKPESSLQFELVQSPVATIAHWIKASKQVLADAPMLQSYIDNRMRYGVEARIDFQLLRGNGTTPNISGMLDSGNHTVFTPTAGENALDSLNRMIYLVWASDYAPTAIIMNPADWGAIERLKVGNADDRYLVGNPTGILGPMLWGLPVVLSNNMPLGQAIVGAMPIAYQVFNRESTVVEMFEQDDKNVQQNLLTIRAEARLALATYVPVAVRAGLLVDATT